MIDIRNKINTIGAGATILANQDSQDEKLIKLVRNLFALKHNA